MCGSGLPHLSLIPCPPLVPCASVPSSLVFIPLSQEFPQVHIRIAHDAFLLIDIQTPPHQFAQDLVLAAVAYRQNLGDPAIGRDADLHKVRRGRLVWFLTIRRSTSFPSPHVDALMPITSVVK